MLPSEDLRTRSAWKSFDEAQTAYDKIIPHQTTVEDLKKLGYDPHTSPNVRLLTYLDVIERFIPNQSITKADLLPEVRDCIESKDCCQAYELSIEVLRSKRHGNVCADILGFRKHSHITGWNFRALIIIKNDLVVYKLRSGQPNIDKLEKRIKPFGPFQEIDGLMRRLSPM
jgi:hypothetical protein